MAGRRSRTSIRKSVRGEVTPSKVQMQLVRDSNFSVDELSLSSSMKGKTELDSRSKAILFTDLMHVATDLEFAGKMNNITSMHIKILEGHVKYTESKLAKKKRPGVRDTDEQLAIKVLASNIRSRINASKSDEGVAIKELGEIIKLHKVNKTNNMTLLMMAVNARNPQAVHLFAQTLNKYDDIIGIARGSPESGLEAKNTVGNTAILIASEIGDYTSVEILAKSGASFVAVNRYMQNVLILAVENSHLRTVIKITDICSEYIDLDLGTPLPSEMKKRRPMFPAKSDDPFKNGPDCVFWTKPEATHLPRLVARPYDKVQRDSVAPLQRMPGTDEERAATRHKVMAGEFVLEGFVSRRVIQNSYGVDCYEYLPRFKGIDIMSGGEVVKSIATVQSPETTTFKYCQNGTVFDVLWYTNDEVLHWMEDPTSIQDMIDKYTNERNYELREAAAAGETGAHVQAIIGRRNTTTTKEYLVSWMDEMIISTWHTSSSILGWKSIDGENIVQAYDEYADQIIRLLFNLRNTYGKSAFMQACEFGKTEIVDYMTKYENWNTDADLYIQGRLCESGNSINQSCLHYGVRTSKLELVKMLVEKSSDRAAIIKARNMGGDTPLLWLSEVTTEESVVIADYLLNVLAEEQEDVPRLLNQLGHDTSTAEIITPNAINNTLMRAAKAGNLGMVQLLLQFGADTFVNHSEYRHKSTFKTAAQYAYDAKFYDVAHHLEPETTTVRLEEEFTRRCKTTARVVYLSDFYKLAECVAVASELNHDDENISAKSILDGYKLSDHRYHHFYGVNSQVYSVISGKDDLVVLSDEQEKSIGILFKDDEGFIPSFDDMADAVKDIGGAVTDIGGAVKDIGTTVKGMPDAIKEYNVRDTMKDVKEAFDGEKPKVRAYREFRAEVEVEADRSDNIQEIERIRVLKDLDNFFYLTYENRLFLSTPPNQPAGDERTLLVEVLEEKNLGVVMQNAMDHYMSRLDLFGRIAKLSVSNDETFLSFCAIIRNTRIYNAVGFCDLVLKQFYFGLRDNMEQDESMVYKVVTMIDTLTAAKGNNADADRHFYAEEISQLEELLVKIFQAKELSLEANVNRVITNSESSIPHQNDAVDMAFAFNSHIMKRALELEITSFFGLPQIAACIDKILNSNLMSPVLPQFPEEKNIFSVPDVMYKQIKERFTAGSERIRYSPIAMFFFECISKLFFLWMVCWVAINDYGVLYADPEEPAYDPLTYTFNDQVIIVILVTSVLRELGEFEGNTMQEVSKVDIVERSTVFESILSETYQHFFSNVWNFLDLCSLILVALWAVFKQYEDYTDTARAFLSCAAIPLSLSILRYAAIEKSMGNLVITVISMTRDFYSFAVVFVVCILGFGVFFRSLFQHDHIAAEEDESNVEGYSTSSSSLLTLLDGAFGQHDYGQMDKDSPYFYIGVALQVVYIILTMVILFNLLIAKMSTTYANSEEKALEEWEYSRATIVEQFLLVGEASPLSALPAPLNLITTLFYLPHYLNINLTMYGTYFRTNQFYLWHEDTGKGTEVKIPATDLTSEEREELSEKEVTSISGTVADYVLAIITAPLIGLVEISSDIAHISADVWRHHGEILQRYKRNGITGDTDKGFFSVYTEATIALCGLAITHIVVHVVASPFLFVFYMGAALYNTFSKAPKLQISNLNTNCLQIKYLKNHKKTFTPKTSFKNQYFNGLFVRGSLEHVGAPFEDHATFIRVSSGPYAASTSDATCNSTRKLAWDTEGLMPTNKKDMVSFSRSSVQLPLFPYSDDRLLSYLQIDIVEKHSAGEIVVASTNIHGRQLNRWIMDRRHEGMIALISHKLPIHTGSFSEEVVITPPEFSEVAGSGKCTRVPNPDLKDSPLCKVVRKGADTNDLGFILNRGTAAANPYLISSIQYDPNDAKYTVQDTPKNLKPEEEGKRVVNDEVRVFHLTFNDEAEWVVHYNPRKKEKSLEICNNYIRRESNRDGYYRELVESQYGTPFLYVGSHPRHRKDDIDRLMRLSPEFYARIGAPKHGFNTVNMKALAVVLFPSPFGILPFLSNPANPASLNIAFRFDIDIAPEYRNIASMLSVSTMDNSAGASAAANDDKSMQSYSDRLSGVLSGGERKIHPVEESTRENSSKDPKSPLAIIEDFRDRFNTEWGDFRSTLSLFDVEERDEMFKFLSTDVEGDDVVQRIEEVRAEILDEMKTLKDQKRRASVLVAQR